MGQKQTARKKKSVLNFSKYTAYHTTGQWWLIKDTFLLFLNPANETKAVVWKACQYVRPYTIYTFICSDWATLGV